MNFTDQLMDARRKAALGGRPLTKQETAGIVAGQADTANARLTRGQTVKNQATQIDLQAQELQLAREREANLMALAKQARKDDKSDMWTGVGVAAGAKVAEPILSKAGEKIVDVIGGWFGW